MTKPMSPEDLKSYIDPRHMVCVAMNCYSPSNGKFDADNFISAMNKRDHAIRQSERKKYEDILPTSHYYMEGYKYALETERARPQGLVEALNFSFSAMQSVLCDPEGNPCFAGSDMDRQIIKDAMQQLNEALTKFNNEEM